MSQTAELIRCQTAEEIVSSLPVGSYPEHYQPAYPDAEALTDAVREVQSTEQVTNPEQVQELRAQLADIGSGKVNRPITITGRCAEPVNARTPIENLVDDARVNMESVACSGLKSALVILRDRGQNTKPRTDEMCKLPDGRTVSSYMGDAVNGIGPDDRTPDPRRMLAAAVQARDLEAGLTARIGRHVPAAHEALLIPYEQSSIYIDTTTGRKYLLSADLPWIGVRTNSPDCAQVEMLTGIENPVGIKIGPKSDAEHIRQLAEKLNPDNEPGKLVFMIRVGADREAMDRILGAIKLYAPNSIHMYDIHGSTVSGANGTKIRAADTIAKHVNLLSEACTDHGLKLHGVHLETTPDSSVTECVDKSDQMPGNKSIVDPQLNPHQTTSVLNAVVPCLTKGTSP